MVLTYSCPLEQLKFELEKVIENMKTTGKVRKDCYFLNVRSLCFVFIKKLFNHSAVFSNVLLDFYSLDDK